MNNFDSLITDAASDKIIALLQKRKALLESFQIRRQQLNNLANANLNKQLASFKAASKNQSAIQDIPDLPDSLTLLTSRSHSQFQYYLKGGGTGPKRIYLSKTADPLVRALAQRDYNLHLQQALQKEIDSLKKLLSQYTPALILENKKPQTASRKKLVVPAFLPSEEYAVLWQTKPYQKNASHPENLLHKTNRGEKVRSKSEALIANELFHQKIPYKYESPLALKNGNHTVTLNPDFIIFNAASRHEIIWEHFGLMDDPQYAEAAIQKLRLYEKNGYSPGKNLIFTMETKITPLTAEQVKAVVKNNFQK